MRPLSWLAMAVFSWWICPAMAQDTSVELGVLTCSLEAAQDVRPADDASEAGQMRNALCSFKAKSGEEETYSARVRSVGASAEPMLTILWLVKGRQQAPLPAGVLEQAYAADPKPPPDSTAPSIIGEVNSSIVLHPMSDREAGSTSTAKKARAPGVVITAVELKLKSTSG